MKLLRAIFIDALLIACLYGWRVEHIEAGRIFVQFWLWLVCAIHWIALLFAKDKHLRFKRSNLMVFYDLASTVALTAVLLWLGWVVLAIALFLGWLLLGARLGVDRKEAA